MRADRAPLALRFFGRNVMSAASDVSGALVRRSSNPRNTLGFARNIRLNLNNVQEDVVMTFSSFRLMQYHQKIDRELRAEISRRWPDVFRIQILKRLKLAIKDRLARHAHTSFGRRLRLKKA